MFIKKKFLNNLTGKIQFDKFVRYKHTESIPKCPEPTYDTGCTFCNAPQEIEESLKNQLESIRNTIPPLNKIIVYLSNNKDNNSWPKKVETYDLMRNMSKYGRGNGNMIVLSSLSPRNPSLIGKEAGFMIFPDAKNIYINLESQSIEQSIEQLFSNINNNGNDSLDLLNDNGNFTMEPINKIKVLICGHTNRDIRCGVIGKLVYDEFIKVLEHENLNDKIDVGYVSHVGGHIYAGNVAILKPDGTTIWYGLVKPQNVQGIVEQSIKGNKIIEQLSRQ